jgi:hypothetical protein
MLAAQKQTLAAGDCGSGPGTRAALEGSVGVRTG